MAAAETLGVNRTISKPGALNRAPSPSPNVAKTDRSKLLAQSAYAEHRFAPASAAKTSTRLRVEPASLHSPKTKPSPINRAAKEGLGVCGQGLFYVIASPYITAALVVPCTAGIVAMAAGVTVGASVGLLCGTAQQTCKALTLQEPSLRAIANAVSQGTQAGRAPPFNVMITYFYWLDSKKLSTGARSPGA